MAIIIWLIGPSFFWEKNNVGFVNRAKVRRKGMEIVKRSHKRTSDQVLLFLEKGRTKPIRARTRISIHGEHN
jgi:late competence protein required for DNA uptake (superfamily II DNA/RNA helicase)